MHHAHFIVMMAALSGISAFGQRDLTSAQILQKVGAAYKNPQRYYFAAVITDSNKDKTEVVIAEQRPDKARIEGKGGGLATALANALAERGLCPKTEFKLGNHIVILIDGQSTWGYFTGTKEYVRTPGGFVHRDPNNLESDVKPGSAADFATHMDDMFLRRYRTYAKFADHAKVLRTELLPLSGQQVACYVIRINVNDEGEPSDDSFYTWWVAKDRFLVLREDVKSPEHSSTTIYTRASVDEPLDPGLFVFTPPPDAREIPTAEPASQGTSRSAALLPAATEAAPRSAGLPPQSSVQVTVPGTANPWLAGMPEGSQAGCYLVGELCDSAPDQSPVRVPRITLQPGASLTFSARGEVSNGPVCCTAGPDGERPHGAFSPGHEGSPVTVPAQNGIQGVSLPRNSLVGVFLGPERPDLSPAPEPGPAGSPALRQVFLIGSHTEATVPRGATRLYLGTIDAYHWSDNSGKFSVMISPGAPIGTTTDVPVSALPFRDDFAGELKPGWQWIDPQGDSVKTLDALHGGLRITVTGPHDLYWETGFEAPRLLREADGDFTLETRVSGPDAWCGGLLVWKDQQNYVRLDRGNHFVNEVSFQASDHGHYIRAAAEFLAGSPVWLRLQRRGPVFTASYSFDGRDWRSLKRRLVRPVTMYPKIGARKEEMSFVEGTSSLEMTADGPFLVGIWGHGGAPDGTEGYLTQTVTDFGYFQIDVP